MSRRRKFPSDATASERTAASIAAHKAAGGHMLNIRLSDEAKVQLRALTQCPGWPRSLTGAVHRLIADAYAAQETP